MRIDRAELEKKAEDAKYHLEQIRQDPERMRRIIAATLAVVVVSITLVVWIVRLIPNPPPPEEQRFLQEHKTTASWVEDVTRKVQRDDRFRNIAVTDTRTSVIIMGRVDNAEHLRDLKQLIAGTSPPVAMQWSVSTDQ